ncbi:Tom7-domain-containing protein [Absidia repens]|uniref:Tom7-domain-containing protein n=1 Tax=Absidia repens TaxID=90262 RepID=A0A1X2I559_9FUNG|nr:Tom7-domain-containing protein [Absidia repens]
MVSESTKETLLKVFDVTKKTVHFAFIPAIIYIGMTHSNPRPSWLKLISPLA